MKRNAEFEVCYYAEANGYLAKGSMTFEDFLILKDSVK